MAIPGEIDDRVRGISLAAYGEIQMAVDTEVRVGVAPVITDSAVSLVLAGLGLAAAELTSSTA